MTTSVSFDRVSDIYDATRGLPPAISEQVTDTILAIASATPDTTFLEPGIGTGRIAIPIVKRGYAYTGVDISENMLNELRQKLSRESHRLTLINASATNLPFADHAFDVVLTVHLLHLIPDWQQALAEIRRVLKPGGLYLYSHGRVKQKTNDDDFNPLRFEFDQQWRAIVASYGHEITDYGATEEQVSTTLTAQGATLTSTIAAQWRIELTVGELLDRYENKYYSACWQVPDSIFPQAIRDLRQWASQRYSSLEDDLSHDARFKLVAVRDWFQ
jgi:ubiquinone/menaquinone biosynthesis C-methylase UbiE